MKTIKRLLSALMITLSSSGFVYHLFSFSHKIYTGTSSLDSLFQDKPINVAVVFYFYDKGSLWGLTISTSIFVLGLLLYKASDKP